MRGKAIGRNETAEDLLVQILFPEEKGQDIPGEPGWGVGHNNSSDDFSITSDYEGHFFTQRQLHTKQLAFRSISKKTNGQPKRRDSTYA